MNILYVSHYFTPEGNAPARRVHQFSREWIKSGHNVTVLTGVPNVPDGIPYSGYRNAWMQNEEMDGIRVVRVWSYLAPNKGTIKRIVNYISFMVTALIQGLFLPHHDVVIATSPQFFCAWAGRIIAWLKCSAFVLEIRDLWPASIQAVGAINNPVILRFLETLERSLYCVSPIIVTVGEGYRLDLLKRNVRDQKIHVIPNGINMDITPISNGANLRQAMGIDPSIFVCAYIGTIGMACGLDIVLNAARQLREEHNETVVFLLVGDGASKEALEKQARNEDLRKVIFTGRVSHDQVGSYLSMANACLIHLIPTAVFESVIPTKLLDAAAASKPVILGVRGVAETMVRTAGSGICIAPLDALALNEAIRRLQSDPTLGVTMGINGSENLRKTHDLQSLAGDYLALLESVRGGRPSPPTANDAANRSGRQK
jgi:glycosyltransferase involved in cell wall biosynthesis